MLAQAVRSRRNGFTLIELLVVIAIIGLLSAVVLAALSQARLASRDAAIQQEVREMAKVLELEYLSTKSYAAFQSAWHNDAANCRVSFTASVNYGQAGRDICEKIVGLNTGAGQTNLFYIGNNKSTTDKYSVMAWLPGDQTFFCVGSSGGSYQGPSAGWVGAGCAYNP